MAKSDNIKRMYYFRDQNNATITGIEWVRATGGTVFADSKGTFKNSFDFDTEKQFKSFESACRADGVTLSIKRGGFNIVGTRLFILYPSLDDLVTVEEHLAIQSQKSDIKEVLVLVWNEDWVVDWVKRYDAELLGSAPQGWSVKIDKANPIKMPADITKILEIMAMKASNPDNKLPWQEIDKLKSDMMKNIVYWRAVTPKQVKEKCFELGMSIADSNKIASMLDQKLKGHIFKVYSDYNGFEFMHEKMLKCGE